MNIAFIGYGNMGSALLNGILASEKKLLDTNIYVFHNKNEKSFQRERCIFKKSGESVEVDFDIIFLCTKPKDIEKSINERPESSEIWTATTSPSAPASKGTSVFMTSRMKRISPALTLSPGLTRTFQTDPDTSV